MMNKEEIVLSALGDLTNGALNYYQATQAVQVRENVIREYIDELEQRIKYANETINNYMMMETDEVDRIEQLRVIKRCLGGKE